MQVALLALTLLVTMLAAWDAMQLARNAPRREIGVWLTISVALVAGCVQRSVLLTRIIVDPRFSVPLSLDWTLLVSAAVVATVIRWVRPLLEDYRAADRARQQSDDRFRRALSGSSEPVGIVDSSGNWVYVNDAGCEFFRYPREQILGRNFHVFLTSSAPDADSAVRVALERGAARVDREVIRGDATRVSMACDLIALGDHTVLIHGHDLTAIRDAEAARIRAQRLEAVSALAAGVAHDFNNLLSVISLTLNLAAEEAQGRVPLDSAIRATERATLLTRELTDFSKDALDRANRPPPDAIDIRPTVREAVSAMNVGLDSRIQLHYEDERAPLLARVEQSDIDRVCVNLLVNARDAVLQALTGQPGMSGRIHVALRSIEDDSGHGGRIAELTIQDNGIGVPEAIRERIFEPFFSTKGAGHGHGIGLAATREMVRGFGGTISVSSPERGDTTFVVTVPLDLAAVPLTSSRPAPA